MSGTFISKIAPTEKYHVTLTDEERQQLKDITTKRRADSQIVKRAFVLPTADESQGGWFKDE